MLGGNRSEGDTPLGRGLGLIVAILLVSLIVGYLAYISGVEGERGQQYPAAYAEAGKEDAQRSCVGTDPSLVFECVYERVEASQDHARAQQDLQAQQGMKFWAAVMAFVAFGTLILTGAALLFIRGTLIETAKMAADTKAMAAASISATDAMVRQNEIAEAAQRPWINFTVVTRGFSYENGRAVVSIELEIENVGNVPAQRVSVVPYFEPATYSSMLVFNRMPLVFGDEKCDSWHEKTLFPENTWRYKCMVEGTHISDEDKQFMVVIAVRYQNPGKWDKFFYTTKIYDLVDNETGIATIDLKSTSTFRNRKLRERDSWPATCS